MKSTEDNADLANPNYRGMTAMELRQIVDGAWLGIAPTYTHEQRFALAELVRRAELLEADKQVKQRGKR